MRTSVLWLIACAALGCGNSGAKPADFGSAPADMADAVDMAPATMASVVIGASGGTVSLPDGTTIDVPAGALAADATITISPSDVVVANAVGPAYTFGPEGQTFAKPVKVTLPYDPARVPSGVKTTDLVVSTAPANSMSFTSLGGNAADATHIASTTTHFSVFVVTAGLPPGTPVMGTGTVTYATDTGNVQRPRDFSKSSISVFVPSGATYVEIKGTGVNDGTFVIPNVPSGPFWVHIDKIYAWTTSHTYNGSFGEPGRPDVVTPGADSHTTFNVTNLSAWQTGTLNDALEYFSLGGRMYQTNIEGSAAPALTAGQNSLSNTNVDFFKSPLIDGTKGDVGYLTQLVTSSLPETTQANVVTRFFQAPSYTAIDGGNPTVSGAFTNVTLNKTLAVNWRRSQFAALKSAVSTASNNCTQLFNVSAVPNGNSGLAPDLLNIGVTGPQVSTDLAVNLQYGNPYPATWTEYATAELICNVGLTAGTTSLQVSAAVYVNGPIASVSAHDVVPLISPPRNLKIAGMDGTGNLTGIGTTPVVSWDPPAMGGPISGYGIYFYSNTGTLNVPVAALFVDGATTSVTVPPVMAVGTPYAIVVESNYSQGSVSGWADLVSGIVTP